MPHRSDSSSLNLEEKSSLFDAVAQIRVKPDAVAHEDTDGDTFDAPRASVLARELLALFGAAADAALTDYVAALLRAVPASDGGVLAVVAARHEALLAAAGRAAGDGRRIQARQATLMLRAALAMHGDAALQPWCDVAALGAEQEQLESINSKERSDAEKDYLRFLDKIEASGLLRRRCAVPEPAALLALAERVPNFAEPIAFFAEQAAFARLRGAASFQPIPVLLDGPAGVGKTHFATALAELLGARTEVLNMAAQTCGFSLSGMDRGWSSARAGLVFGALLHGASLAPVIVLDELDKASSDARHDPVGPLYTLLEPRSSRAFRDEFAGIPVDASGAIWLATSNERARIPSALLSRLRVFEIAGLDAAQLASIAEGVFASLADGIPGVPPRLPAGWQARLAGRSARQVRIALQQGLGRAALRAVRDGASAVVLQDDDLAPLAEPARRSIGFH